MNMNILMTEFVDVLLANDREKAQQILEKTYGEQRDFVALENLVVGALEVIGDGWEEGEYSLAQVYMGGVICEELISPFIPEQDEHRENFPKMAICVFLDHHSLGKRIVLSVLKTHGFSVLDFGAGLSVDELVRQTIENEVEVLLISTLMLASALKIPSVKSKLLSAERNIKIIAGGAPFRFDKELWKKVGVDGDGGNATDIVKVIETVVKNNGK